MQDIYDRAYDLINEWNACKRITPVGKVVFNCREKDLLESKAYEIKNCILIWDVDRLEQACSEFTDHLEEYKKRTVFDILAH